MSFEWAIYTLITISVWKYTFCGNLILDDTYDFDEDASLVSSEKHFNRNGIYCDECSSEESTESDAQCNCDCDTCSGPEGCCQVLCPECRTNQPNMIFVPYAYPLVMHVPGPAIPIGIPYEEPKNNEEDTTTIKTTTFIINTQSTPFSMVLTDFDSDTESSLKLTVPANSESRRDGKAVDQINTKYSVKEVLKGSENDENKISKIMLLLKPRGKPKNTEGNLQKPMGYVQTEAMKAANELLEGLKVRNVVPMTHLY